MCKDIKKERRAVKRMRQDEDERADVIMKSQNKRINCVFY